MIFNSIQFIWTLPTIFIIYYLIVLNLSAKKIVAIGECASCNNILLSIFAMGH